MGYLTLGVLALTVIALGFGALFGMMRGRNRAILRLALVLVCIVLAILLRGVATDIIMDINFGGETIKEMLTESLTSGETALPESMQNLVFTLVEILIGLIAFFLLFFVLRLITWILVFPICKIFVKKGAKKRKGFGALIGLVQGILIAVTVWGPATGLVTQMNKLSKIEIQGERMMEIPAELGMDEYVNSPFAKVYNALGGWLFDILSSTKTDDGKKVSIEDTCDVVDAIAGVSGAVTDLQKTIKLVGDENATPQEQIDAMHSVGDLLIQLDTKLDDLSTDAKTLVNDLLNDAKEMLKDGETGEIPPEVEKIFDDIDIDKLNLDSLGNAVKGIANYIRKTADDYTGSEVVTQNDADSIVNGLAGTSLIFGLADMGKIIPIKTEHSHMFSTAVENTTLSAEDKSVLRSLLGLS